MGMPMIGEEAPEFTANSTQGEINFPGDYFGKWKILFSHPGDFTPVCTSEMLSFALMVKEMENLDCQLVGLSVDGLNSHLEWVSSMEEISYKGKENIKIDFPIVSDLSLEVSKKYGMIHPESSEVATVRGVFIIDPENVVRSILYYPMEIGRNIPEIGRVVMALQTADKHNVVTPADWQPGDDVLVRAPATADKAKKIMMSDSDLNCFAWYFCFKAL
jgi:peroxiredoxin (alkyl hydroperoxide reductase subunit C)